MRRARTIGSGIVAGVILAGAPTIARAQPAPATPDLERAKALYIAAEAAVDAGRYDDAIRDYGYAYAISKDPVLFFKIGGAHERAGRCDAAISYYRRYLAEGAPEPAFVAATRARITACGGDPAAPSDPDAAAPAPAPDAAPAAAPPSLPVTSDAAPPAPATALRAHHQGPWLLVGGSLALLTIGAVLAYSAEATENDLADLYVGLEGEPPVFDARTRQRYDDVLAEGDRYALLARVSFGLAGALALGAGVWFYADRDRPRDAVRVTPHATPGGGGVTTTIRF